MDRQANSMAHEDIWDDSALVDSWNEALAEYEKYHSIHALGGSLEDLQPEHAKTDTELRHGTSEAISHAQSSRPEDEGGDVRASARASEPASTGADGVTRAKDNEAKACTVEHDTDGRLRAQDARENTRSRRDPQQREGTISTPQALLGSVQDESLKRLLMSWYYAGYYTGLHEGQQQTQHRS